MILDVHPLLDELAHARHLSGSANASTMTLVVFLEDERLADWVRERTRMVATKHPSRVVILDGTREAGDQHLDAPQAHGEWVDVGIKGAPPDAIAQAMASLAQPEAPVVLAWIAPKVLQDERFFTLAPLAQTILVSTSVATNDDSALEDFLAFSERSPDLFVQDLAYLRLASWQELVAEFFDEREFASELGSIQEVEVAGGSEPEQYYLLGWLASRLGWTPCAGDQFCNREGEIIRFSMSIEGEPRRLSRVVLRSAHEEFHAQTLPDDPSAVALEIRGDRARAPRFSPLHSMDIATLVERGILSNPKDAIFTETLASVKRIIHHRKG